MNAPNSVDLCCLDFTSQLSTLRLATISLARRHCNFQLGTRLLLEQMSQMVLCEPSESGANNDDSLLNAFAKMHACSGSGPNEHLSLRVSPSFHLYSLFILVLV